MAQASVGICPYCVEPIVGKAEREHVFPRSWYPDDSDPRYERPTVASCGNCNRTLGAVEQRLFYSITRAISPYHPNARGVRERAESGQDASGARTERERRARRKAANDVQSRIRYVDASEVVTAPIGAPAAAKDHLTPSGLIVRGHKVIGIDNRDLAVFGTKLVRGMYRYGIGACLPKETRIGVQLVDFESIYRTVEHLREKHGRGPFGVPPGIVWCGGAVEGTMMSVWAFEIWGQVRIVAQSHDENGFRYIRNIEPIDPPILMSAI
jgi:hypothetical protein